MEGRQKDKMTGQKEENGKKAFRNNEQERIGIAGMGEVKNQYILCKVQIPLDECDQ